jgi:hypothetical protein
MDFALFVKFQLYGLPGVAALIGVNNLPGSGKIVWNSLWRTGKQGG